MSAEYFRAPKELVAGYAGIWQEADCRKTATAGAG